ncbi:hypothetical protein POM88_008735 [Heracleum sosnowskyi]|uniref:F-box domain-containing protein n=1 Tax=Heracleum sosnowskyi TaxID=360622 RepID=A0AAD8J706_9APIA|nr:hypothetical protein POM88_008735 [Heracleum sosnowskyi]
MAKTLFSDLPEGMITEVLVRLPVKTVLQCKSVCKPWLSIISNPHFIKSQLHHAIVASQNNPTLLTLAKPPPTESELLSLSFAQALVPPYPFQFATLAAELQHQKKRQLIDEALLDVNGQDLSSSPVHFDRVVIPRVFYPHIQIVGSCNGVICLSGMGARVIYLWNPSIRQCKKLDTAPTRQTSSAVDIGFGYDSVSKDYKVLTVVYEQNADNYVPVVQVYSTNANCWREFWGPILKNSEFWGRTNIVVNGILYFASTGRLCSFDLNEEVFGFVPYPSSVKSKKSDVMDFKGSAAMVFESEFGVDVWTLDDVCGELSWTKKFSIAADPDPEIEIRLSNYLGAGQFCGIKMLNSYIPLYKVLYDYEKKETKIYGLGEGKIQAIVKYIGTLVRLDGFEPVDSDIN